MEQLHSKKTKVALFDVCKTLVRVTTITDFTENFLLSKTRNPRFRMSAWLRHLFFLALGRMGFLTSTGYRQHLVSLFRGYSEQDLRDLYIQYAEHLFKQSKPEIIEQLNTYKNQETPVFLVSAGLRPYLIPFAERLGVALIATDLEVSSKGTYTGNMGGIDCLGEGKVSKVKNEISFIDRIDWQGSIAFGDSKSDIPMFNLVGNQVAVDPEEQLLQEAKKRGWHILISKNQLA